MTMIWLVDLFVPLPPAAGLGTVVVADHAVAPMALGWRLLVLAGWGLGAFVGGAVAAWLVGRRLGGVAGWR